MIRFRMNSLLGLLAVLITPWLSMAQTQDLKHTREVKIPWNDIPAFLHSGQEAIFVSREEWNALLLANAREDLAPAPTDFVWRNARYQIAISQGVASIAVDAEVEVLTERSLALPLGLHQVRIERALEDEQSAKLHWEQEARWIVQGKGTHRLHLDLSAFMATSKAIQKLGVALLPIPVSEVDVIVDGNIEMRSGAAVRQRTYDADSNKTRFQLVTTSPNLEWTMSLNNKTLREDRTVLASSLLIADISASHDTVHVTTSFDILNGASESVSFEIPDGYEVLNVQSEAMARWKVDSQASPRKLVIDWRSPVLEKAITQIALIRTGVSSDAPGESEPLQWRCPAWKPLDVDGFSTLVGIRVDSRLSLKHLEQQDVLPIDQHVLADAPPTSSIMESAATHASRMAGVYFAPQGTYRIEMTFVQRPQTLTATNNFLMSIEEQGLAIRGGISLQSSQEKLFGFDMIVPASWKLVGLRQENGEPLKWESVPLENQTVRVHVTLPHAQPVGTVLHTLLEAKSVPTDWLTSWQQKELGFPHFEIQQASTTRLAVAIQASDDFELEPVRMEGLSPLFENEKARYHLAQMKTAIALSGESNIWELQIKAQRTPPRKIARIYNHIALQNNAWQFDHQIQYEMAQGSVQELRFSLPSSTPEEIALQGIDDVAIKESNSQIVGDRRVWTLRLAKRHTQTCSILIQYVLPHSEENQQTLSQPTLRAEDVAYQTGFIALEGDGDHHFEIPKHPKAVDVGEWIDSKIALGSRLIGVFGYQGSDDEIQVSAKKRDVFPLPSTIADRLTIETHHSGQGLFQESASFSIRSKDSFIEVELPPQATFWTATLDGQPILPQKRNDRLLIEWTRSHELVRSLVLIYELRLSTSPWNKTFRLEPPRLSIADASGQSNSVPITQTERKFYAASGWSLSHSQGMKLVDSPQSISLWSQLVDAISSQFRRDRNRFTGMAIMLGESPKADDAIARYSQNMDPLKNPNPLPGAALGSIAPRDAAAAPNQDQDQVTQFQIEEKSKSVKESAGRKIDQDGLLVDRPSLIGLRSLPISMVQTPASERSFKFESLSDQATLQVTLVPEDPLRWLSLGVALVVFLVGWILLSQKSKHFYRFLVLALLATILLPTVLPSLELGRSMAKATQWAIVALTGTWWFGSIGRSLLHRLMNMHTAQSAISVTTARIIVITIGLLPAYSVCHAYQQENTSTVDASNVLSQWLASQEKDAKLAIPNDVVIVPYDPSQGMEATSDQLLVSYAKYVDLWNRTHPNQPRIPRKEIVPFAFGNTQYQVVAAVGNHLELKGKMEIDVLEDGDVIVPLHLHSATIMNAQVGGAPAQLQWLHEVPQLQSSAPASTGAHSPGTPNLLLHLSGKGKKVLELTLQLGIQRDGGWRRVEAVVPMGLAGSMEWNDADPSWEVRWLDRESNSSSGKHRMVLNHDGFLHLHWRPKLETRAMDQGLSVESTVTVDIQVDRIRTTWNAQFSFRGSQRNSLTATLPKNVLVEKVTGENVRGWKLQSIQDQQQIEVTLLKPATEKEGIRVQYSEPLKGSADAWTHDASLLQIPDAIVQQGTLTLRKSSLLNMDVMYSEGLSRTDLSLEAARGLESSIASPIPLREFQSYRFSRVPFPLRLAIRPTVASQSCDVQTVVRLSSTDATFESKILLRVKDRSIFESAIQLPSDWEIEPPMAPVGFDWYTQDTDALQTLHLHYREGLLEDTAIVIRGKRKSAIDVALPLDLPNIEVLDQSRSSTSIAILSDPGWMVRPDMLTQCVVDPFQSAASWLSNADRSLLKLVLRSSNSRYSAKVTFQPRLPEVLAVAISNCKITERSIEDTILLDWQIRDAGIVEVSFELPDWVKDPRIKAPLMRRIRRTASENNQIRYTIELQESVLGQLRVIVEHDRPLELLQAQVVIPTLITGKTLDRFVVLENAGRDEWIAKPQTGLSRINPQSSQWKTLAKTLGDSMQDGFVTDPQVSYPTLLLEKTERARVQTAEAKIGIAKTTIVMDIYGAYRATQEYRIENRSEQYLEVQLPPQTELWSVMVADQPTKPIPWTSSATGSATGSFRIPLVKTEAGDLDYGVILKYAGKVDKPSLWSPTKFPLMHTVNIPVELSQVRLLVPKELQWFDFQGTLGRVDDASSLAAGWLAYKTKQVLELSDLLSSQRSGVFSKARAAANLKQLQQEVETQTQSFRQSGFDRQTEFNESSRQNLQALSKAQSQAAANAPTQNALGNRERFNDFYAIQDNGRGTNAVLNDAQVFQIDTTKDRRATSSEFNKDWIATQGLAVGAADKKEPSQPAPPVAAMDAPTGMATTPDAVDFSKAQGGQAQAPQYAPDSKRSLDYQQQARKYQEQLENQVQSRSKSMAGSGGAMASPSNLNGAFPQTPPVSNSFGNAMAGQLPPSFNAGEMRLGESEALGKGAQVIPQPAKNEGYLASLDVPFPEQGQELYFVTPRGEIELQARALDRNWIVRATDGALGLVVIILAVAGARLGRWLGKHSKRMMAACLVVLAMSLLLCFLGVFLEFAGVVAIASLFSAVHFGLQSSELRTSNPQAA